MKKKIGLMASSATLVAGTIFGLSLASPLVANVQAITTTNSLSRQQTLQNLPDSPGISQSILRQNSVAEDQQVLARLVKNGKLTRAQSSNIQQTGLASTKLNAAAMASTGKIDPGLLQSVLQKYQSVVLGNIAQSLHMNVGQLQLKLHNGKTPTQIARAQHISTNRLRVINQNAVTSALSKAQKNRVITAQQLNIWQQYLLQHPDVIKNQLNSILQ